MFLFQFRFCISLILKLHYLWSFTSLLFAQNRSYLKQLWANPSRHFLKMSNISESILSLIPKEQPWANRSCCSVKKSSMNSYSYFFNFLQFFKNYTDSTDPDLQHSLLGVYILYFLFLKGVCHEIFDLHFFMIRTHLQ